MRRNVMVAMSLAAWMCVLTACVSRSAPKGGGADVQATDAPGPSAVDPEPLAVVPGGGGVDIQVVGLESLLEQQAEDIVQIWGSSDYGLGEESYALNDVYKILDAAIGDLDGDGWEDLAVVVEAEDSAEAGLAEGDRADGDGSELGIPWEAPRNTRETFALLNDSGSFRVFCRNKGLVMGAEDGGVFGDPFEGVTITDGRLSISNYGGSNDRWGYEYSFIYEHQRMRLSGMEQLAENAGTGCGTVVRFDYLNGTYERHSIAGMEEYDGLLLACGTFHAPESYFEDAPSEGPDLGVDKYLPDLTDAYYGAKLPFKLQVSANGALDMVRQLYYGDMVKKELLWTDTGKENYEKLLHLPMPDWYYERQDGRLMYRYLALEWGAIDGEVDEGKPVIAGVEDDGITGDGPVVIGAEHVVRWESFDEAEADEVYYIDALTGAIRQ